ncbi:MAG TPA: ATP-binding protein [Verrucomicrobiota bacterium]|nr:ATP-binding protein [Verrucomicrobiota bacterium]
MTEESRAARVGGAAARPIRVMIVEDDAIVAAHLRRVMEQMGFEVAGLVATGKEAVQVAGAEKPDVILMDINLRGDVNGLQAAEKIHEQHGIPVIYLTAYADEAVVEQAKRTQPYGYLTKPVRDKELRASLEMALFKSRTDRRLRQVNSILRSIRDVSQLITRERDGRRLMQEACRVLVSTRGYLLVWIGRPDPDSGRLVVAGAAGLTDGLPDAASGGGSGVPDSEGLPESVLRTGQPAWCRDTADPMASGHWREAAWSRGFRSAAAIPMRRGERLYGVLNVYADQVEAFDREEIALLQELADDLALGLESIEEENVRFETEAALRQARNDLERRVDERTAELRRANAELRAEIAARQLAEAALSESQAQLRAILDNIPDLAWLKDRRSVYLAGNEALARALGRPLAGILGKSDSELLPRDVAERQRADDLAVIETGQPRRIIEQSIAADGRATWVETIKSPVRDVRGEVIGIAGIGRDITELKRAEERILESLERERQLHEMKTRFISTASHEFRTPMTVAAGFAEMLRNQYDRLSEEKRRALLDRILDSVWRVTRLLDDVLTVNRVDQGKLTFRPARLNLSSLVRDVIDEICVTDKGGHAFNFDDGGGGTEAVADENLIRPILTNLLTNAVRYSATGSAIVVRLRVSPREAVLEVADHGIGIAAGDQARIFEPFERGVNVGKTRGSGMGLNIVKRLVDLHRGSIQLSSEVGVGSTFTVRLPLGLPPAAPVPL